MIKRTLLTVFLAAALLIQPVHQKRAHACPDFTGVLVHCAAFQLIATFQAFYLANLRNPALGLAPLPGAGLPIPDYSLQPWADPLNNDLMFYFILTATGGRPLGSIDEDDQGDESVPGRNRFNRGIFDSRRATNPPISCDTTGNCSSSPVGGLFGGGPNSGYLCDSGGTGCGNDRWNGVPQTGFGECGAGGCSGPSVVLPLNVITPRTGPYVNNVTRGNVNPFGGGPTVFLDPDTGKIVDIGDDRKKWPERVRHADDLNAAYINGDIKFYPFSDPNWATKSVEDMKNSTPPPSDPQTAGGGVPGLGNGATAVPYTPNAIPLGDAPAIRGTNIPPPHTVKVGETLFRLAVRYGVSMEQIAEANNISPRSELTLGQTLQIPASEPTADSSRGPKFTDKAGRFGIGEDRSLGGVGGRSGQMQIANNFGLQGILSYTRLNFEPKPDNSDLTSYVSKIIFAVEGHRFASGLAEVFLPPTTRPVTIIADGNESAVGDTRFRRTTDGKPVTLPPDPESGDQAPGIGDTLTQNVPNEFRAPYVGSTSDDGRTNIFVKLPGIGPGTGTELNFATREGADAMVNALRDGKSKRDAHNAGRAADNKISREDRRRREIAEDTGIITTPSGLASASEPGARTSPPPRPAPPAGKSIDVMEEALFKGSVYKLEIIQTPDGRTLAVGTGEHAGHVFGETKKGGFGWRREGPWTPPPAPAPFVGSQRPAIIVSPTQTDNPPDQVVTDLPGKIEPGDKVTVNEVGRTPPLFQNDNVQIRVQIANSDRNHMTQPGKITFDPSAASGFSGTGR